MSDCQFAMLSVVILARRELTTASKLVYAAFIPEKLRRWILDEDRGFTYRKRRWELTDARIEAQDA